VPARKLKSRELVKIGLSTSIPKFYLDKLEEVVMESKGRLTLASLVRSILMDFVEKRA
jgi:hypothetical protein